jgi:hypothetical protein
VQVKDAEEYEEEAHGCPDYELRLCRSLLMAFLCAGKIGLYADLGLDANLVAVDL